MAHIELEAADPVDNKVRCPSCEGTRFFIFSESHEHTEPAPGTQVSVIECCGCHAMFTARLVPP